MLPRGVSKDNIDLDQMRCILVYFYKYPLKSLHNRASIFRTISIKAFFPTDNTLTTTTLRTLDQLMAKDHEQLRGLR